jgi:Ca-activated chloride channel homolog
MSFIWPPALAALLAVPLGVLLYWFVGRGRRRRLLAGYGGAALAAPTARRRRGFGALGRALGRRVPALLVIAGVAVIALALARPQATVALPQEQGTVMLVFDVSASMKATDLTPTRLDAAKAAAKAFVEKEPSTVAIGVVAFSNAGASVQAPTYDQPTVISAIERLSTQRSTSIADGIAAALQAIAAAEAGGWVNYYSERSADPNATPKPTPTPFPSGVHAPAVIVLLTDGENTAQSDPLKAAQSAADAGVRIYTVGIGSAAGTDLVVDGVHVTTTLDEQLLQQIATVTGGTYYAAADTATLMDVYSKMTTGLVSVSKLTEVTSVFAGIGAILVLAGAMSSLVWLGRMP